MVSRVRKGYDKYDEMKISYYKNNMNKNKQRI